MQVLKYVSTNKTITQKNGSIVAFKHDINQLRQLIEKNQVDNNLNYIQKSLPEAISTFNECNIKLNLIKFARRCACLRTVPERALTGRGPEPSEQ